MAEFLTMEEAEDKFGKKGTARAGLTLGIIGTASNFFGFSTLPAQTVVTYVVRNWVDKHNGMIDLFVDKDGNINAPLIADALKSELKARGGFTIGRVKFSDSDVDELLTAFNQAKQKNR